MFRLVSLRSHNSKFQASVISPFQKQCSNIFKRLGWKKKSSYFRLVQVNWELDKGDPPVNERVWHCLQHFHPRHSSDCWILAGNACINLTCKAPYEGQGDKPRSIVSSCLVQLKEINPNIVKLKLPSWWLSQSILSKINFLSSNCIISEC